MEAETEAPKLSPIPRQWDWVLHDGRRYQEWQTAAFAGMARYYEAADAYFLPRLGDGPAGGHQPAYSRGHQLRFELPETARQAVAGRLPGGPKVAVLPAGSGARERYPSATSWEQILRAVREETGATLVLIGKSTHDGRTSTVITPEEHSRIIGAVPDSVDCFDLPIIEELAVLQACDVLLSPHSGMGFTASCVDTPWAVISGGRWHEYFTNRVPFRSVLPDPDRYPCFTDSTSGPRAALADEDGEGLRIPSMTRTRIEADLKAIVQAVVDLAAGATSYEECMRAQAAALVPFFDSTGQIFSFDGDLVPYLEEAPSIAGSRPEGGRT